MFIGQYHHEKIAMEKFFDYWEEFITNVQPVR